MVKLAHLGSFILSRNLDLRHERYAEMQADLIFG